jgi:hypothetical protein
MGIWRESTMKIFRKHALFIVAAIAISFSSMTTAATVYVPSFGSTGTQTFSYTFTSDFSGYVTIGVSDVIDDIVASYLDSSTFGFSLNTDAAQDTSAYFNTVGEQGTDGELYTFSYSASAGDVLSFSWEFYTDDYVPFSDFAFIDIEGVHYEVLAQIATPIPAAAWLFGSGLLGLLGFRNRSKIAV